MLLTNVLLAGSALYIGGKKYQSYKKKKNTPWTFYAERMKKKHKTKNLLTRKNTFSKIASGVQKFQAEEIAPLLRGVEDSLGTLELRDQQLRDISNNIDDSRANELERKLNRDVVISSISLGFVTAGALIYTPLRLLSVPGLCWITVVTSQDAYRAFKEGRGIGVDLFGALFFVGTLTTGSYFAGALGASFIRLSKKLLAKTEDHVSHSLINVFGNHTRFVWLLKEGSEIQIAVEALKPDDIIVVHAGETIPVDGTITLGSATVDQRILTGESQPAEKKVGDQAFASTIVLSGNINICVEKAGQETIAAQIGQVLNQTADFKKDIQSWGEEIADKSTRITMGISALLLPFFGTATAVTIMNASFGLYMRFLGPISMLTFLNLASQKGILVKDGRSLQLLTHIDTVVFDKTGTLTLETPSVGNIYTVEGICEEELLTVAAAAEYKQTHPIAKAILEAASERHLSLPKISEAQYEIGYGLKVSLPRSSAVFRKYNESSLGMIVIRVGSRRFMEMEGIVIPPKIKQKHKSSQEDGHSLVYVAIDEQLGGAIELHATIRPEAREVINELRKRKMELVIISGDHLNPTRKLAEELGIDHYFAETLPENKADLITKLQEEGKSVCFVGDGINDSIALKKANVSISLRGASSAATDSAQIVLMNQDLNQLIQAFDVAQHFERNMQLNLIVTVIPGVITVFGAFFLGFGIAHSVILNDLGVMIGASNAIWPWLKEGRNINRASQNSLDVSGIKR